MARPKNLHLLTGRPSRYTIEVAAEILQRMCDGEPLFKICQDKHLPADSTVRYGADCGNYPEFTEAFRIAKRQQAHRWFEETVALADESEGVSTVAKLGSYQLRVNARRWAAARMLPEEYGDKVQANDQGRTVVHVYLPEKRAGDAARVIDTMSYYADQRQIEGKTDDS